MLSPQNLAPDVRVPALLIFGGFESAGQVLELIHPEKPVVLASFDYPFSPPREFRFPESLGDAPALKRLFPLTRHGIRALVDRLKERSDVDPKRVIIVGASFGSPFALAAAAENPAIQGVAIIHGFGKVPETLENVILRNWEPRYGFRGKVGAWFLAHLGWNYLQLADPEILAENLRASQSVLMITAENDSFIPRKSSDSLWQAIESTPARRKRILMKSDHLMPGSDTLIQSILQRVQAWVDSEF